MTYISDKDLAQYKELGYIVTEPAFTQGQLDEFGREADRLHEAFIDEITRTQDAQAAENARLRPFIGQAHAKSDFLREFVKAPVYLEACAKLIGPDADLYYNQVVTKPPEKGKYFGWHQDSGYVLTKPLEYITCWTAISRTYIDNGCIWIVPGSHKAGKVFEHVWNDQLREHQVQVNDAQAMPVEMKPGQVAIFSSLLLHKSGPNVSKEIRRAYVPQYHVKGAWWPNTDKPAGDHYPVLRNGVRVDEPLPAAV